MSDQSLPQIMSLASWKTMQARRAVRVQTLSVTDITIQLSDLCADLREQFDLCSNEGGEGSIASMMFDVMSAIGMPVNAICMVLTSAELEAIGVAVGTARNIAHCQLCGEEATGIGIYRGQRLLMCPDCLHLHHQ